MLTMWEQGRRGLETFSFNFGGQLDHFCARTFNSFIFYGGGAITVFAIATGNGKRVLWNKIVGRQGQDRGVVGVAIWGGSIYRVVPLRLGVYSWGVVRSFSVGMG